MLDHNYQAKLRERAEEEDFEEELAMANEYELDLNNLPKLEHNWVKRGDVLSCEGANHPYHRHFLIKKRDSTKSTQ